MAVDLGKNAKVYRNTGTYAVPVFSEIDVVANVSLNVEKDQASWQTRADDWKKSKGTGKDATVELEIPHDTTDANTRAFLRSVLAGEAVELFIMSKTITVAGSEGLRANFEFMTKNRQENIDGILMNSYTGKLTDGAVPMWYVCATKAITSGSGISDDVAVYWDGSVVTTTASTNEFLGYSVGASLDATAYMYYDADRDNPA